MHRFILEGSHLPKLDSKRKRVRHCPCEKKNDDGKFVPFEKFEDRGYCHSCCKWFPVACHPCPGCRKEFALNLYIDTEAGNIYVGERVGKCLYCSYHYPPKQYFEDNAKEEEGEKAAQKKKEFSYIRKNKPFSTVKLDNLDTIKSESVSFIPAELFKQSLKGYDKNNFVQFLIQRFGPDLTGEAVTKYFIGTSKKWEGANQFWQIDSFGNIRTGKIMLYSPSNGKRVKEPYDHITWVHTGLNQPQFHLKQCFFGQHLLKAEPSKPVAICESEKGAIIGSLYFPQFIWIAAGSKDGLNAEKCKSLQGRCGMLFPDLNAYELWAKKQKEYEALSRFKVSDLLQNNATEAEIKAGLDLADYLLKFPVAAFRKSVLQLYTSDIVHLPSSHQTGSELEHIIIQGVKTKDNRFYDLFFTVDGQLIKSAEQAGSISRLAAYFEKHLQPATMDGESCLVHLYN